MSADLPGRNLAAGGQRAHGLDVELQERGELLQGQDLGRVLFD